ncbi:glycosyltransferase [Streptomyces sp. YS415]|uniref:glycosyltransferase n=1 Tax=Streptomyces sp. YS415 TaxID=2944806 RepID=UPI00202138B7|nr:glycosyltransferase [Streptomyces sp. YS415]MCL7425872.1 glycosyltransferase [Streptomyces sp. YS415]
MSDRLRVTVVASTGVVGEAESWLLSLLDATDRLAVEAVLPQDGPLREEFTRRGMPSFVRATGDSVAVLGSTTPWLVRHLRATRPDVLLADGVRAALAAAPAAWLAGVRCVWVKHDHAFDGPVMALLAALTDGCVATEPALVRASRHPEATLVPSPATGPDGPRMSADLLAQALAEAARLSGAGLTGTAPVSVMTCFWNEGEGVDRLLELLLPQLTVDGDEIVVVDDGSTDDTADRATAWAADDARVHVLGNPHRGLPATRNAGVRAARNPLIACTDAGCVPAPDWLARLRAAWAEPRPADLLTGGYRVSSDGVSARAMALVGYPVPEEVLHPGPWTRVYTRLLGRAFDASTPSGRSMAFTRAAWQDAEGFTEHLKTAEDLAFARDVIAAGGRAVLVTSAEVEWAQRPTMRSTAVMYYRYGQGSGQMADGRLLGRDALRAVAYLAAPAALARGPRARALVAAAALTYLSLPMARAVRGHHWSALPLIPLVTAVRDLAKTAGAVHGLTLRLKDRRS